MRLEQKQTEANLLSAFTWAIVDAFAVASLIALAIIWIC